MSEEEAYYSVFYFYENLTDYANRSSLMPAIHGGMQLSQDGRPIDVAVEEWWKYALKKTGITDVEDIEEESVYQAAYYFIEAVYQDNSVKPEELRELLNRINQQKEDVLQYWKKALDRARSDSKGVKLNFT